MENNGYDMLELAIDYGTSKGASYVEGRLIDGQQVGFFLRNGAVMSGAKKPWQGIGLRLLVDGGLSFCSVDELTKDSVRKTIDNGIKMAKVSNPERKIDFGEPISNEAKWKIPYKDNLLDVDNEQIIDLLKELDNKCEEYEINSRTQIFESHKFNKYILTSEGTKIQSDHSMLKYFNIMMRKGLLGTEQRMVDLTRSTGWEGTKTWLDSIEKESKTISEVAEKAQKGIDGKVDFIVGPEVAGIIAHENCGHPSEADRILGREGAQAGESFWRDLKLGESKIGSEQVTLCDDPTIPETGGFYLWDDEGVKARNRILIKDGIINEPLTNRQFAVEMNFPESNGSSRAENYNREPIVRMANTYFAAGDFKSLDELVEDVKHGIFMNSFTEWNIDDRRYQSKYVGQECYLIKDGEITETMVRRPVLEITSIGLFSSVDGVTDKVIFDFPGICGKSDPGQGVPVWAGGGFVRMRNIQLG